jgi:hypothetical protein
LPDPLDRIEDGPAAMLPDRVAKNPPEQPDIFAQREVFVLPFDHQSL